MIVVIRRSIAMVMSRQVMGIVILSVVMGGLGGEVTRLSGQHRVGQAVIGKAKINDRG